MYVSLKWKAVVFLSMVLLAITAVWILHMLERQLDRFQVELNQTYVEQNSILQELVRDNFLKLSQFSQLIASKEAIASSLNEQDTSNLVRSLRRDWVEYNANLGLDYLAVFDHKGNVIGEEKSEGVVIQNDLLTVISERTKKIRVTMEPEVFIYCDKACAQFVIEPIINNEGREGAIVLGQSMAEISRAYHDFSKSNVGILIAGEIDNSEYGVRRQLDHWKVNAWAVSEFDKTYPVLKKYSARQEISVNTENELFSLENRSYLIKELRFETTEFYGHPVQFLSIDDKTVEKGVMDENIESTLVLGGFGLFFSEMVLLFLINSPMRKLMSITEALLMLPRQEFVKAVETVSTPSRLLKNPTFEIIG